MPYMTLLVKGFKLGCGAPDFLDVDTASTLAELHALIEDKRGVPPALQRLTAKNPPIELAGGEGCTLESLGLTRYSHSRECVLDLTFHHLTICQCAFCTAHPAPPLAIRAAARAGWLQRPTAGLAPGHAQANLVLLPSALAPAFRAFCAANPQACPLLEEGAPGALDLPRTCPSGCDIRSDLPKYQVWRHGRAAETCSTLVDSAAWAAGAPWSAFALGCSFSFEEALQRGGVEVRHVALGCNVPMFRTSRPAVAVGPFAGPLVVSMRPMSLQHAVRAASITAAFPRVHGAPVQVGTPEALGIASAALAAPHFGDAVPCREGEVPVFWACGVTALLAAAGGSDLCITHAPGHMLVLDVTNAALQNENEALAGAE